eukprot:112224-Hanusia_phi.AAC.4
MCARTFTSSTSSKNLSTASSSFPLASPRIPATASAPAPPAMLSPYVGGRELKFVFGAGGETAGEGEKQRGKRRARRGGEGGGGGVLLGGGGGGGGVLGGGGGVRGVLGGGGGGGLPVVVVVVEEEKHNEKTV